jgi:peptide/nickel transport system substrate-binding protein
MKRKIISVILAMALFTMTAAGCAGESSEDAGESSSGNILIIADTQCPTSLDPAQSWDSWYTSRWGITETLYKLDGDLEPQPLLATSCEMEDETTWVITLREGVTFQNGEELTAQSVKDCWERTAGINARFNELLYIDSMEADGLTLRVTTSKPVPSFINGLCEPLTCVIDVDAEGDIAEAPVGTGPFKAVSYEVKTKARVERYDGYWGGTPKLDGAVINIISDTNTLALAQQSGESDVSVSMPAASLELFSDTERYNVDSVSGSRGQVLFINFENEFLKQLEIRQAIAMCIDKESCADILNKGASVPSSALYPDFMELGSGAYEYDPDGAKALLDEAGIVDTNGDGIREYNGKNVSLRLLTYTTKAELSSFCSEISSAAYNIGIDLTVEIYESITEQEKSGDFDMLMVSFAMVPTGDPQYFADIAFKTDGSSNYGGYSNPEVDELIEELDKEFDAETRRDLSARIQSAVDEDVGYIVVGHSMYTYVMGADVKGLETNPSEYYLLDAEVYIER